MEYFKLQKSGSTFFLELVTFKNFGIFPFNEWIHSFFMSNFTSKLGSSFPAEKSLELYIALLYYNIDEFCEKNPTIFQDFDLVNIQMIQYIKDFSFQNFLGMFREIVQDKYASQRRNVFKVEEQITIKAEFLNVFFAVLGFKALSEEPTDLKFLNSLEEWFQEYTSTSGIRFTYNGLSNILLFTSLMQKKKNVEIKAFKSIQDVINNCLNAECANLEIEIDQAVQRSQFSLTRLPGSSVSRHGHEKWTLNPSENEQALKYLLRESVDFKEGLSIETENFSLDDFLCEFVDSRQFAMKFFPTEIRNEMENWLKKENFTFKKSHFDFPYFFDFSIEEKGRKIYLDVVDQNKSYFNFPDIPYFEERCKDLYCKVNRIPFIRVSLRDVLNNQNYIRSQIDTTFS